MGSPEPKQYTTFIAQDWKHDLVHECSCDPGHLGNYFVESDLPFQTSPAFFRPEVRLKYKANPDKYQMEGRSIRSPRVHLETIPHHAPTVMARARSVRISRGDATLNRHAGSAHRGGGEKSPRRLSGAAVLQHGTNQFRHRASARLSHDVLAMFLEGS